MKKKLFALMMIVLLGTAVFVGCSSDTINPNGMNQVGDEVSDTQGNDLVENVGQEEVNNEETNVTEPLGENKGKEEPKQQGNSNSTTATEKNSKFSYENQSFKVYEPIVDVQNKQITVKGLARVFEATIQYEFEDGHFLFASGFTTASEGAPGWGEFEIILDYDVLTNGTATIFLFEESAKDGSRLHEIYIPVTINNPFAYENHSFKVFEPTVDVQNRQITVKGFARVFEGTIQYEFEDGHYILDAGFTTASDGPPNWGEFKIEIEYDVVANNSGTIILFEESAKDGSRLHEIYIPVRTK